MNRIGSSFRSPRCPMYRGSSVEFNSCLNLTRQQFIVSTNPNAHASQQDTSPMRPRQQQPRIGPYPSVQPARGQLPVAGFHPAPGRYAIPIFFGIEIDLPFHRGGASVRIMTNPNRGRGGASRGNAWNVNGTSHVSGSPPTNGFPNAAQKQPSQAGHRENNSVTATSPIQESTMQL